MVVKKTESRIPEGFEPQDLGQAFVSGDYALVSYLTFRALADILVEYTPNRYLYQAIYVDGSHNRRQLSIAAATVHVPRVTPPQQPVITKILGGDVIPDENQDYEYKILVKGLSDLTNMDFGIKQLEVI